MSCNSIIVWWFMKMSTILILWAPESAIIHLTLLTDLHKFSSIVEGECIHSSLKEGIFIIWCIPTIFSIDQVLNILRRYWHWPLLGLEGLTIASVLVLVCNTGYFSYTVLALTCTIGRQQLAAISTMASSLLVHGWKWKARTIVKPHASLFEIKFANSSASSLYDW